MLFLLDSANIKELEKAQEIFPLAGVTTNPSIIAKENRNFFDILQDIRAVIGPDRMLHAQVLGETCEDILKDAETIRSRIGGELYIKVPVTIEGYRAMPILKQRGYKVTATAIYTPGQALLAAQWGVDFTAPYVNRIDNISGMGVTVVKMITDLFSIHHLSTRVLAASFKNLHQVNEISLAGCQAITVGPDILWKIAEHTLTDMSIHQFQSDWKSVYGDGKFVYNL
ncbi:MAG: fructose-6-phosphate aldolase [Victivallaceae bacterium]|nr:fructose-6-phosphate aldolase [Victivallaceae bacterium]